MAIVVPNRSAAYCNKPFYADPCAFHAAEVACNRRGVGRRGGRDRLRPDNANAGLARRVADGRGEPSGGRRCRPDIRARPERSRKRCLGPAGSRVRRQRAGRSRLRFRLGGMYQRSLPPVWTGD